MSDDETIVASEVVERAHYPGHCPSCVGAEAYGAKPDAVLTMTVKVYREILVVEREACAKVAEESASTGYDLGGIRTFDYEHGPGMAGHIAAAIRARGAA